MKDLSLIVPTYNEREGIEGMLLSLVPVLAPWDYEVIVADDDSPDGTGAVVERLTRASPLAGRLCLLRRTIDRGLSPAVVEACGVAQGRFIGVMDADRSHDETLLPALIRAVEGGAEVAVGSRRVPGGGADNWPWYRRWTSGGATLLARALLGLSLRDPMSGYFVMRREVFERGRDRLRPRGYKILLELVVQAGVPADRLVEIPYVFKDRRQGYSKLTASVAGSFLGQVGSLAGTRFFRKKKG